MAERKSLFHHVRKGFREGWQSGQFIRREGRGTRFGPLRYGSRWSWFRLREELSYRLAPWLHDPDGEVITHDRTSATFFSSETPEPKVLTGEFFDEQMNKGAAREGLKRDEGETRSSEGFQGDWGT